MSKFPIHTTMYLHGDRDSNYDLFQAEGLTIEEIRELDLQNIGSEIQLDIIICEQGTAQVLSINGIDVEDRSISI